MLIGATTWIAGDAFIGITSLAISTLAMLVEIGVLGLIYTSFNQTRRSLWRFPLGCEDLARILKEGASVLENGEPVIWGGREYVLEPR